MVWGVFGHSMWATPHDQIMWSCPVGQLRMEGIGILQQIQDEVPTS